MHLLLYVCVCVCEGVSQPFITLDLQHTSIPSSPHITAVPAQNFLDSFEIAVHKCFEVGSEATDRLWR